MAKGGKRVSVDRAKFRNYLLVAENFFQGSEIAREYEYWNAAGVLIVHCAIAYADAVSIKLGGVKSHGENHYESIALLNDLLAEDEKKRFAVNQLQRILDHKTSVSYSGEVYGKKDIDQLWKYVTRFKEWADGLLE